MYISTCMNKDVGKQSPFLHSTSTKQRIVETLAELTTGIVTLLLSGGRCLMATLPDTFTGILQQLLPVTWEKKKKKIDGQRLSDVLRIYFHNLKMSVVTFPYQSWVHCTDNWRPDTRYLMTSCYSSLFRSSGYRSLYRCLPPLSNFSIFFSDGHLLSAVCSLGLWTQSVGKVDNRVERMICKAFFHCFRWRRTLVFSCLVKFLFLFEKRLPVEYSMTAHCEYHRSEDPQYFTRSHPVPRFHFLQKKKAFLSRL